jgi:UDP-N-acetylglucosamine 2-epimerase (hydrolysing)
MLFVCDRHAYANNIYKFINQGHITKPDTILSNTILGFHHYVDEVQPDMIIVHGDRIEAMAGAIVGSFNNILVAHIEGGEISGTLDESIRHSITKLSHLHFVSNEESRRRLIQMGENDDSIFVIGSPEIDVMLSPDLPLIEEVKKRYDIPFENYAILLFHPVTTELTTLKKDIGVIVTAIENSERNYIVVYPNNDSGSDIIFDEYKRFDSNNRIKIFPSLRFEYYLTLLKNADFIIGNSSSGIREAMVYGIAAVNIGSRQNNRISPEHSKNIINAEATVESLAEALNNVTKLNPKSYSHFGRGRSAELFQEILLNKDLWSIEKQKVFIDLNNF